MKKEEKYTQIPTKHQNKSIFGIGVWHPKSEINIGTLIRSAYIMGANYVFTIGKRYKKQASGKDFDKLIPVFNFEDFRTFRKGIYGNSKLVCIEIDNKSRSLSEYVHPYNAVYLLGAEDHGLSKNILEASHKELIYIPGKACLNVAVAGSIVMYDRNFKMNNINFGLRR